MHALQTVAGVVAAAVAVWLAVRIVNRRERWAIRTAAALAGTMVGCLAIGANLRPEPVMLGHVSFDSTSPYFPGLTITGDDYGWPWTYKTESFKPKDIQLDFFDEFRWLPLIGNAAVGIVAVVATAIASGWILYRFVARCPA